MSKETSRSIVCEHAIGTARASVGAQVLTITGDRIFSIEPTAAPSTDRWLAMPALVNAHDHGRAIRTSSIGADAKPLESSLHYLAPFPSVAPYLAAAMAFSTSALGGAGTVMVHYTRAQGLPDLPTEAAEVARAARDVGIRAGFAVSMKDRNPLVYEGSGPCRPRLPPGARAHMEP